MISQETSVSFDYHSGVCRIGIVVLSFALFAIPALAQIHGVPASVTSLGPGRGPTPGVPASVTSLGPNGFDGGNQFVVVPNCCNPLFVTSPFRGQFRRNHHHHFISYYPVPVYTPYYADVAPAPVDDSMEEDDRGGPTLFDRRGPGQDDGFVSRRYARDREADTVRFADRGTDTSRSASPAGDSAGQVEPATTGVDQAPTVLVFKDGHKLEVKNYAIVSDVLYDLTPGHSRRIALSDLDLAATQKVNEDQGVSFQLPAHTSGS